MDARLKPAPTGIQPRKVPCRSRQLPASGRREDKLSELAVALLVFLAGAARARIVATDLRLVAQDGRLHDRR
jgi:hypothetical protein